MKVIDIIEKFLRKILIGRDSQFIDKVIFWSSRGNYSGWVLGNKLKAFAHGKRKGTSKEPLIFIGGYPRSGTTLLQILLDAHKNISSPNEEVLIFQDINSKETLKKKFEFSDKEIKRLKLGKNVVRNTEKIINLFKKKNNSERILLKRPKNIFFMNEIFKRFPNSKFIHIIRNGKDATMSQRFYCLYGDRKEWPYNWCCRQWVTAIKRGKKHRKDSRYIEIFYEELLDEPYKIINNILNFLGLEKMKERDIRNAYKKVKTKKAPYHPGAKKPIKKTAVGKWVKKMNKKDKETFNKIAGKLQKELGY